MFNCKGEPMTKSVVSMILAVPLFLPAQSIQITADRESYVYECGEPATFSIQVLDEYGDDIREGKLTVVLNNFGAKPISERSFDLAGDEKLTCSGALDEPGFIKCVATIQRDKPYRGICGVAVEPEKIRAASERPADFDAYWNAETERLDKEVPLDPRIERMDGFSNEKHESFRVSFATFNNQRVYGFLSVPKGEGPFPAEVQVPGAGPGIIAPQVDPADQGFIRLVMNVHPYEPPADMDTLKKLYDEQDRQLKEKYGAPRYCQSGAATRETFFYHPVILGINRAVNWLAQRPDVDTSRFYYTGTSQGGGFGLYLCGLNRHFVKGAIFVPALCDLSGFQAGRTSGWPRLIEAAPESIKEDAIKTAPYFDGGHFAVRIACPVRFAAGFVDEVCPPASVYAAYNALRVKDRDIVHGIGMPHRVFPEMYTRINDNWLRRE
jgi:cephalosporin-C deacetylase